MSLPDLAKPWPVRFTGRPDFLSPPSDGDDPCNGDEDGAHEEHEKVNNITWSLLRQRVQENDREPEEITLREGHHTTCVLRELGAFLRKISVYEDRSPDADGKEHHRPPSDLPLPKHCVETMTTPEGSDSVTREVDVDGRAYEGDNDHGVEPGEVPSEEGNRAGNKEGIRDEGLRPEGLFDTPRRIEYENG